MRGGNKRNLAMRKLETAGFSLMALGILVTAASDATAAVVPVPELQSFPSLWVDPDSSAAPTGAVACPPDTVAKQGFVECDYRGKGPWSATVTSGDYFESGDFDSFVCTVRCSRPGLSTNVNSPTCVVTDGIGSFQTGLAVDQRCPGTGAEVEDRAFYIKEPFEDVDPKLLCLYSLYQQNICETTAKELPFKTFNGVSMPERYRGLSGTIHVMGRPMNPDPVVHTTNACCVNTFPVRTREMSPESW